MNEWKPYVNGRVFQKKEGYVLIKPEENTNSVPLDCPLCRSLYRSIDDQSSHLEWACCHLCALRWAHARKLEWHAGWRPSEQEVKDVVSQRPGLSVTFDSSVILKR